MATRKVVGVTPPDALVARPGLFNALSAAYGVEFVAWPHRDCSAVIAIGIPVVSPGVPSLNLQPSNQGASGETFVELSNETEIDPVLRGRRIREQEFIAGSLDPASGDRVLATANGAPVWTASAGDDVSWSVAATVPELLADERLKLRLRDGRFVALMAIAHFLRDVVLHETWVKPAIRASFIIDDPNLHATSYGYVDFEQLAAQAQMTPFHVSVAMVPADARFASRGAVSVFRNSEQLSLIAHGNDHVRGELSRAAYPEEAIRCAAQAVRRMERFERRYGLRYEPVMAPPHGACSVGMMQAMSRVGFAAVTYHSGPIDVDPADVALVGWRSADLHVGDGLPGLHREVLDGSDGELALRAFLGQPLMLYLHHNDLGSAADALISAAERVNRLGNVEWKSIGDIAASLVATNECDGRLDVRTFSRHASVSVSEECERMTVEAPGLDNRVSKLSVRTDGGRSIEVEPGESIDVRGAKVCDIDITHANPVDARNVSLPSPRVWPVARRIVTEGRDRLLPLLKPAQDVEVSSRFARRR